MHLLTNMELRDYPLFIEYYITHSGQSELDFLA